MIEVVYYRESHRVTIRGHARSAEYGKDLICSAVSTLALTLCENIKYLEQSGFVVNPVTKLESGNAEISCLPSRPIFRASVRQIFMSVCVGFQMLGTEYPDYISYRVEGW
jgi:uncharacterized protein YsxB (DUF464 family)